MFDLLVMGHWTVFYRDIGMCEYGHCTVRVSTLPVLHIDNCGSRPRLTSLCRLLRPYKPLREIQVGLARLVSIFVRNVRSRLLSKSRSFAVPVTIAGGQFTRKHTQYSRPLSNGSMCNPLCLLAYATPYQKEAVKKQASKASLVSAAVQ